MYTVCKNKGHGWGATAKSLVYVCFIYGGLIWCSWSQYTYMPGLRSYAIHRICKKSVWITCLVEFWNLYYLYIKKTTAEVATRTTRHSLLSVEYKMTSLETEVSIQLSNWKNGMCQIFWFACRQLILIHCFPLFKGHNQSFQPWSSMGYISCLKTHSMSPILMTEGFQKERKSKG